MKFLLTATCILLSLNLADTKMRIVPPYKTNINKSVKPQVEHTHERRQRSPIVQAGGTCSQECIFKDYNNQWCLETTSPMLTAGWQIVQTTDSQNYWSIQMQPYLETQMSLTSEFVLNRLFANTINVAMSKFKSYMWYSFTFGVDGQACYGFGYASDEAKIAIKTLYTLIDCYKLLWNDLSDTSEQWTGDDALWLDACNPSASSGDITLKDWTLMNSTIADPVVLLGGTTINYPGCFKFGDYTEWAPYYSGLAFKGLKAAGIIAPEAHFGDDTKDTHGKHKEITNNGIAYSDKDKVTPKGKECKKDRARKV